MTLDRSLDPELSTIEATSPYEAPSQYAELVVQLGPAQPWGTAKGKVPPEQAHHLITTFGIVAAVIAGIAGTVLTLRISAQLAGPAYAELGLAFGATVLIAIRRAVIRAGRRLELPETRARGPGSRLAQESVTGFGPKAPDP
jgi:hypothetical protein